MDWPAILVSTGVAAAASVGAAYLTAQATTRSQLRQWRSEMAEKYATLVAEHPGKAQALARQFAVGVLVVEGSDPSEREKIFIAPHIRMTAGRDPSNEVVLATNAASRRHFAISASDRHVFVEDLGSANGTFVNGQQVSGRTPLRSGDVIHVDSSVKIEFQSLAPNL